MREMKERNQVDMVIIPQKKKPKKQAVPLSLRQILLAAFGVLAARAVPLPGIAPFGIAYLSAERTFSYRSILSLAAVLIGYLTLGDWCSIRYMGTAIVMAGYLYFSEKPQDISAKTMAILSGGTLLLLNAFTLLFSGFSFGGLLTLILDSAMTVLGVLVFDRCKPVLSGEKLKESALSEDEQLSLWILLGVALLSLRNLWGAELLSLANVAGYTLLGFLAVVGGLPAATLGGPILGILLGVGGDMLVSLSTFGCCGLVCGIAGRFRKYVVAGSIALTGILLTIYTRGTNIHIFAYLESVLGGVLLLLIPESFYQKWHTFIRLPNRTLGVADSFREQIEERLTLASESFRTLADTFVRISDKEDKPDSREVAALFDLAASQVCRTCSKSAECWKRNFNATYQTLYQLLERLERKGAVRKLDVDPFFTERCLKLDAFLTEINRLYEIYKINQVWKQKLSENRLLVGEQFSGVAEILDRMNGELHQDFEANLATAGEIQGELEKLGLRPGQVTLSKETGQRQSVRIALSNQRKGDLSLILSVLRQVLGKTFTPAEENCPGSLLFREVPSLSIYAASASSQKEEECGDAYALNQLRCGKYIASLCDGMGTGHRASQESNATISLLNAFLEAGFDKTIAVKLINSVMVMKSAKEAFTTVDLCMVDLYTGETEFIKNGAEPSYIKRESGTETIRSASLPVGVLSGVEVETFAHRLSRGDTVVMVSDGLSMKDTGDDWLRRLIDSASLNISPQDLADEILDCALSLKGGEADDDMTVLVLRLDDVA